DTAGDYIHHSIFPSPSLTLCPRCVERDTARGVLRTLTLRSVISRSRRCNNPQNLLINHGCLQDTGRVPRKNSRRIPTIAISRQFDDVIHYLTCQLCIQGIYSRYANEGLARPRTCFCRRTRRALPADC